MAVKTAASEVSSVGMGFRFHLALSLALIAPASAQQLATVTGRVTDPSDKVVVGAAIKLTNSRTGERHTTSNGSSGSYMIGFVKPGRYTLDVEAPGFEKFSLSRIEIETGATVRADARLEGRSISLRANPALLNTDNAAVSSVIRNRAIINLPLLSRRAAQLASLSGFVVQRSGTQLQIAGGRSNNAAWTLDGGSIQGNLLGVADLQFDPPVEALNEVHVEVSNYRAELGRSGGGIVQMSSLAGTNQFRGVLYQYLRNDSLDARHFFARDKQPLRGNQFGGSYGGPIVKNRTFFHSSMEWVRRRSSNPRIENIPAPAETHGDFSQLGRLIRNSATRDPLPNNIIPASQLDPVGLAAAELWPDPNLPGRPSTNRNYFANASNTLDSQTLFLRLDHTLAENHRVFGRYVHSLSDREDQSNIWPDPVHNNHILTRATYFNASLTAISNLTPKFIVESRLTWSRRKNSLNHSSAGKGFAQRIGFSGANPEFFPGLRFAGGIQPIGRFFAQGRRQNPIRDTLFATHWTYVAGKHSLKWGGESRFSRTDDVSFFQAGGALSFNPIATGDTVASLLHGWVADASRDETLPLRSRAAAIAAYLQDDWKLTPRLTLNLGLRYDLDNPRWESFENRQNSFDSAALNPACNCPGVITFGNRYAHNFAKTNFSPRVGFAYRPSEDWVIRGGGSVVYLGQYDQATSIAANAGFSIRGQFTGLRPFDQAFPLRDGLPPIAAPALTPEFGAVPIGQPPIFAPEFFQPEGRPNPYLITYNLHLQRRLSKTTFAELGYIATLGRKLTLPGSATLNQIHPSQIHLIDEGAPAQTLRPFPQFSDVRMLAPNFGSSAYHGVNIRLLKRVSAGLEFGMSYTFARALDNVESRNELGGDSVGSGGGAAPFANQYDRGQAWSLGGNHIKHRYIAHAVWDIPYGKRRENEFINRWWNHLIGGWTLSTIVELRTGPPFSTIWGGTSQIYPTAARVRADSTRPYRENPNWRTNVRGETFFDPATFAQPRRFTFGNLGRNAFIGPGAIRTDVALIRRIYVPWQSHNMQLRAEVFNLLNRANFGLPDDNAQSASFGRITTLAPGASGRLIQLGIRYAF